ncbi:uncharacterized protein VTP21DRAFT_6119 [Calcarisporiella thermophila]|uniref:uncharacterized protein n=1 Tax=Calcarisporiella thermophila TaxID=911321 RepID=UPI003744404C
MHTNHFITRGVLLLLAMAFLAYAQSSAPVPAPLPAPAPAPAPVPPQNLACSTQPAPADAKGVNLQSNVTKVGNVDVKIAGLLTVDNMCQFTVHDFTYVFALPDSYWYGSNSTDPKAISVAICPTAVGQNSATGKVQFTLSPNLDFSQFSVIKLFSMASNPPVMVAVAQIRPLPSPTMDKSVLGNTIPASVGRAEMNWGLSAAVGLGSLVLAALF